MLVSCTHCQNSFEHEAPAYARGAATAVCPSCGRDTPAGSETYGMEGGLAGPSAESRVYCFNCGKSMTPREGELIPVCDGCRQDRAAEAADERSSPDDDEPVADWMIRKANANVYGPFPSETIVEWIQARKIQPDEEVAHIGGAWRLFSQHEEFGKFFEKPAGTESTPQQEQVDFRQKNTGRAVVRAVVKTAVALLVFGALAYGVHYAIQNQSLVVSESAVEKMVDRVSDFAGPGGETRNSSPLAEDAGKLLFTLAKKYPEAEGFSMERTLRGRTLMLRDNLPNLTKARAELEEAVVLDPNNALALAALAELYNILAYQGYGNLDLQRQSIYLLDLAAAEETFEAEVLRARAGFLIYSSNVEEGRATVQEALSRNPGDPELHFLLALASLGPDHAQTDASRSHFEKALELDPGFHQVWYELARGEEGAGRLREAIAHYRKKLELDTGSGLSHYRLGRIYEAVGERKKAAGHYDQAIGINKDHKDSVLRRAVLAAQVDKNYRRAATLLRGLWDGTTGEVELRIHERKEVGAHLAGALRLSGDTASAVEIARELLETDKNYGPALFHLGMALIAEGKVDEALPSLNRADESDISKRERAIIKYQVGKATNSVGRSNAARDAFNAAIDFDPTYVPAHIWLAEVKRHVGSSAAAGNGLMKHITEDPLDYLRPRTLSPIFEPVGDLRSIGTKLKTAATAEGFAPDLYSAAGIAYFHGGDAKAAADAFKTALAEDPAHPASIFYLGLMDFDSGRMPLAAKRFEQLLGIGNDPIFHVYLAETLASSDRLDEAVSSYERGLGYGLKSAWAHSRFAATLAEKGEEDRARAQLDRATELDTTAVEPRRARFQYNL